MHEVLCAQFTVQRACAYSSWQNFVLHSPSLEYQFVLEHFHGITIVVVRRKRKTTTIIYTVVVYLFRLTASPSSSQNYAEGAQKVGAAGALILSTQTPVILGPYQIPFRLTIPFFVMDAGAGTVFRDTLLGTAGGTAGQAIVVTLPPIGPPSLPPGRW